MPNSIAGAGDRQTAAFGQEIFDRYGDQIVYAAIRRGSQDAERLPGVRTDGIRRADLFASCAKGRALHVAPELLHLDGLVQRHLHGMRSNRSRSHAVTR
jgi:hypothetical protein